MIAKRIMRGKAGDFGRLGDYIVRGTQKAIVIQHPIHDELAIWQKTAEYIVDAVGGGTRAAAIRITNCEISDDVELAIIEIIATQKMNKRARGSRTYHLVVSFPPGEIPTPEQLADIEGELCKAIGLGEHQRISAVHTDTEHLHMHIAINQIHPQKLICVEPWQDRPKLMKACERLEIKHGLRCTNHGKGRESWPHGADALERYGKTSSLLGWLRTEVRPRLLKTLEEGQGWRDLHALLQDHGLVIRRRGAGLVIGKINARHAVKASTVDRLLSMKALQDRWGAFEPIDPATPNRTPKYRRGPMYRDIDELFEDWRRLYDERSVALEALNVEIQKREKATKNYYQNAIDGVHRLSPFTGIGRQARCREIAAKAEGYRRDDRAWAVARRKDIFAAHPVPSWLEFLRQAASMGNAAALRTLRRNAKCFQKALNALVNDDVSPDAKATITVEFQPTNLENGQRCPD
jgi:hypothetical protein